MKKLISAKTLVTHPALMIIGVVLVFWELSVRITNMPEYFIIPPSVLIKVLVQNRDVYWGYLLETLKEANIGFFAGTILAVSLAVLLTFHPSLRQGCLPLAIAAQTTPVVVYATYMLIILGPGELPSIVVAAIFLFFSTVVVVTRGLAEIDPILLDAVRLETSSQWEIMHKVRFPLSVPYIVSALKIGITSAIVGAIVAEWVNGGGTGIGHIMLIYKAELRTPEFLGAAFVAILASTLSYAILAGLEKLVKWDYR